MKTALAIGYSRADATPSHRSIDNPRRCSCRHPNGAPSYPLVIEFVGGEPVKQLREQFS
jgi:hypothetical protein